MKKIIALTLFLIAGFMVRSQSFYELNDQFIALYGKGDFKNAIPIGLKAVEQAKKDFGTGHQNYAIASLNIAEAYYALKEFSNALPFYKQAIKTYTIALKTEDNISIAMCNNSLGNIYLTQKKYDSSAIFFENAFNYFIKHGNEQYNNVITLMNNLSELYLPLEQYKEMKEVFIKTLPVIEAKEGLANENYRIVVTGLVNACSKLKDYTTSERCLRKSIVTFENKVITSSTQYAEIVYLLANCLKEQDKNNEAIVVFKKAKKWFAFTSKENTGKKLAFCSNDIGLVYLTMKQYDSSAVYLENSFAYFLKNSAEDYENAIALAENLSLVYVANNKNLEQKNVCEKIIPIIEKREGIYSSNYCVNVYNLCGAYKGLHDYTSLKKWAQKLILSREKMDGNKSKEYAEALDVLGISETCLYNFKEAEVLLLQSVEIKKSLIVKDTVSLITTLNGLADLYSTMGNYNKAYNQYNLSLYLLEQMKLQESENYLITLRSLGYTYIEGSRFADAKAILNKVMIMQIKMEGDTFSGNAEILVSIANSEYQLNEISAAKEHAEKAIAIATKNFGNINSIVETGKELLALVYHKSGNSNKAIELFKEALKINENLFGSKSSNVAATLSNLSLVYQEVGKYADAEIALQQSVEIRKSIFGVDHPMYALSLMNLAMVYAAQAGYDKAIGILKTTMDIYIKREMAGTNDFLKLLNNLTIIVNNLGAYDDAKKLYLQTLKIIDDRKDSTSIVKYFVLNNLSSTCIRLGNYDDAVRYALQAMDFAKRTFGIKSIEYIKSANNCSAAYKGLGQTDKAKQMQLALIPICKEILGDNAELLSTLYFNLSLFSTDQKKFQDASDYLKKSLSINLSRFKNNFYTLSEKEKLDWWQDQSYQFSFYPSLIMHFSNYSNEMIGTLANQQLELKSFVLNDASAALRKARAKGNKGLNMLIDNWQASRTLLSKQLSLPVEDRYYKTDSLENIANTFEKSINQQAAGIININAQKNITWQTIQSALKNDEAAVEFMRFPFYRNVNFTDTFQYAAIIIRKDQAPQFVVLGTEQQINWCLTGGKDDSKQTRINSLYRSSLKAGNSNETFAGDSLYNIIWKPLMPYLQNINTISYSPDGLLHKIAFHALPVAKEKLLIDIYRLQEYTSIRQIAEQTTESTKWNSVYLMGNADFNTLSNTTSTAETNIVFNTNHANDAWVALPGTAKEIYALQLLFASKGVSIISTNGSNATEEKFKSLSNHSPSIIHLATHGFFIHDPQIKNEINLSSENSYALSDNPLMRSGVIMAGANKAWSGQKIPFNVEDGIVTAYEIAQLNLSDTKLVVLSACETALGDLQGTEGVFGLQRAIKIAGVKNLIVSLWQVPDKETAELMGIFYNNLLSGISVREAFYKTQKEMRSKYPPYSWAAFVLIE